MIVLGVDPGATTGWCLYDGNSSTPFVMRAWKTEGEEWPREIAEAEWLFDQMVIEQPKGYGATHPAVVDCAWVAGQIYGRAKAEHHRVVAMTRLEVKQRLREATHGEVPLTRDRDVWAALVLLHGEGSDRKTKRKKGEVVQAGGPIGDITSHQRAALAVAVASLLPASGPTRR